MLNILNFNPFSCLQWLNSTCRRKRGTIPLVDQDSSRKRGLDGWNSIEVLKNMINWLLLKHGYSDFMFILLRLHGFQALAMRNFVMVRIFRKACIFYFQVTAPGGSTVHTLKGTSGNKFEFKAPRSGMYKFCFHNPYSTPETVSFYIHVGHIPTEHDLAKDGLSRSLSFYSKEISVL